jgi:hypothetical protein
MKKTFVLLASSKHVKDARVNIATRTLQKKEEKQ